MISRNNIFKFSSLASDLLNFPFLKPIQVVYSCGGRNFESCKTHTFPKHFVRAEKWNQMSF